jgi:hypothetical protein
MKQNEQPILAQQKAKLPRFFDCAVAPLRHFQTTARCQTTEILAAAAFPSSVHSGSEMPLHTCNVSHPNKSKYVNKPPTKHNRCLRYEVLY